MLDENGLNTLVRRTRVATQDIQDGLQPLDYHENIRTLTGVYFTVLNVIATIIKGR